MIAMLARQWWHVQHDKCALRNTSIFNLHRILQYATKSPYHGYRLMYLCCLWYEYFHNIPQLDRLKNGM